MKHFHTIKSILNAFVSALNKMPGPYFHTIKSILNSTMIIIFACDILISILLSLF